MSDPTPPPSVNLLERRAAVVSELANARESAAFVAGRLAELDAILALLSAPPADTPAPPEPPGSPPGVS